MHPNTRPPDIGLLGRARAGKDTAAAILARKWGHERLAFAAPLRSAMEALDPIVRVAPWSVPVRYRETVAALGYEGAKDECREVRRLLQHFGTGLRDHLGPDVWVDALVRRVEALEPRRPVVVTDVRFENEARRLRSMGFLLVRLTRAAAPSAGDHVSEVGLDGYPVDAEYANDGTPEDLEAFLDQLVLAHPRDRT